jgi:hypothetical protein
MDIQEFLELLKNTKDKYKWVVFYQHISGRRLIRTYLKKLPYMILTKHCPITGVYGSSEINAKQAESCGLVMGLTKNDVSDIIQAADDDANCDRKLRADMLEVLGLEECKIEYPGIS